MSSLKFTVEKKNEGCKLTDYLKEEIGVSTRLIRKSLKEKRVIVDNEAKRARYILKEGDTVIIEMSSEETQDIAPENIPIEVVYEDDDILVVNKPPFIIVHPTSSIQSGTLANAVTHYFRSKGENTIIRLVNRLDRDTSGLVVIAKSQYAHMAMARKMQDNEVEKSYVTVVEGSLQGEGTIDEPIGRPSEESLMRCVMEGGQRSITHYRALNWGEKMSTVNVILETGRCHQIRVHMKHIGHPILGDTLYNCESDAIGRQALHAYKLRFNTIRDNTPLEIVAPLPEDLDLLVKSIEK